MNKLTKHFSRLVSMIKDTMQVKGDKKQIKICFSHYVHYCYTNSPKVIQTNISCFVSNNSSSIISPPHHTLKFASKEFRFDSVRIILNN